MGRGRPRTYCSSECRREAESDARRLTAQIEHHRTMADMLTRDLAAFDLDTAPAAPNHAVAPGIEVAVARAEGVLLGLNDGSTLATEFNRLLEAVRSAALPQDQQHRAS